MKNFFTLLMLVTLLSGCKKNQDPTPKQEATVTVPLKK